ncbi:MAG: hypothetical protein LBR45_03420 [Bacteroidales bacterium]|jgi:hypothetical protein|nr:hypothetical protein [Bacteroidales bacterium]
MKKLLLILAVAVITTSCYKEGEEFFKLLRGTRWEAVDKDVTSGDNYHPGPTAISFSSVGKTAKMEIAGITEKIKTKYRVIGPNTIETYGDNTGGTFIFGYVGNGNNGLYCIYNGKDKYYNFLE